MKSGVFLSTLSIATLTALVVWFLSAGDADKTACLAQPTSDCLIERALAAHDGSPNWKLDGALRDLGRFETADALMAESVSAQREPPPYRLNQRAEYRLKQGEAWRDVLADIEQMDPGELYLLGTSVARGHSWTGQTGTVPYADAPAILDAVVAEMQRHADLPEHRRLDLAELLARTGRKDEAAAILMRNGTHPDIFVHRRWMQAVLSDDPNLLRTAFQEAFRKARDDSVWPRFHRMERLVQRALDAGEDDLALEFAVQIAALARQSETPFRVADQAEGAKALIRVGREEEAGELLDTALVLFAGQDPDDALAFGLVAGPMRRSFIDGDVRTALAPLAVALGRTEWIAPLAREAEELLRVWSAAVAPDLDVEVVPPIKTLLALIEEAESDLPAQEIRLLRQILANRLASQWHGPHDPALAAALLEAELSMAERTGQSARRTAFYMYRTGLALDDPKATDRTRALMAQTALREEDVRGLANAVQVFHRAETAAR